MFLKQHAKEKKSSKSKQTKDKKNKDLKTIYTHLQSAKFESLDQTPVPEKSSNLNSFPESFADIVNSVPHNKE